MNLSMLGFVGLVTFFLVGCSAASPESDETDDSAALTSGDDGAASDVTQLTGVFATRSGSRFTFEFTTCPAEGESVAPKGWLRTTPLVASAKATPDDMILSQVRTGERCPCLTYSGMGEDQFGYVLRFETTAGGAANASMRQWQVTPSAPDGLMTDESFPEPPVVRRVAPTASLITACQRPALTPIPPFVFR